jgi:hypothetical protein
MVKGDSHRGIRRLLAVGFDAGHVAPDFAVSRQDNLSVGQHVDGGLGLNLVANPEFLGIHGLGQLGRDYCAGRELSGRLGLGLIRGRGSLLRGSFSGGTLREGDGRQQNQQ